MKKVICASLLMTSFTVHAGSYLAKLNNQDSFDKISSNKSLQNLRELKLSFGTYVAFESTDKSVVEALRSNPEVSYVENNAEYRTQTVSTDPMYSQQWGLKNNGRNSGGIFTPGRSGEDINVEKAWELTRGTSDVIVAVIDTGIDYNHVDLKNNILVNEAELNGLPGVDDDGNGYVDDVYGYDFFGNKSDPMDGHGHGTHCAGVIGALNNTTGIAGISSHVKLLPIKFLSDQGSGSLEGAIKAIDYGIKRGVHVMNNSWGGGNFTQALFDAIKAADEAGIVFLAASGNSKLNNDTANAYPANYEVDNVISVGAMDGAGSKASFSNYGRQKVHVFAPGVNILSTVQNNGYKKMSGTSMACPHVSGIVALMLSEEKNMTPKEVRERLISTSAKTSRLGQYSQSEGRVDAYRALRGE